MTRTKHAVEGIGLLFGVGIVLTYGLSAVIAAQKAPPKVSTEQTSKPQRGTGTLKAGYGFDHTTIPSLSGFTVDGDRDLVYVEQRDTMGVRWRIGLTNGSQSVLIHIGLTQGAAVPIDSIIAEFAEDSQMEVSDRFVEGSTVGISVGDQSLVDSDSTSIEVTREIVFSRANIFVAVLLEGQIQVNLLPIAQDIDADIQSLPDVTQPELDATRPVITTFEADTVDLDSGEQATLTLNASDPEGGSLSFFFEGWQGYIEDTPPPLRYRAGSSSGTQVLTVVAINSELLYAEASISFNASGPCTTNEDCATAPEATFCTFDSCEGGTCTFTPGKFGDVAGPQGICGQDGSVGLLDIIAVLNGFGGEFRDPCTKGNIDIGGAQGACEPNGVIELGDIIHVLNAFAGAGPCVAICNAGGPAVEAPPVRRSAQRRSRSDSTASFTLVPTMRAARGGDLIEVDVFVGGASDVRGYELAVEAVADASAGPPSADRVRLELVDVSIDTTRADYLLRGVQHVTTVDATAGRLAAAAYTGGVTISHDAYVGTFTFRTSSGAASLFRFDVRSADTTVLDSTGGRMAVESSSASISVGPPTDGRVGSKPTRHGPP